MTIGLLTGNVLVDYMQSIYKHHKRLFLLLGLQIRDVPRGTKDNRVNPWKDSGVLLVLIN